MDNTKKVPVRSLNQYIESKSWEHFIPFNATFELTYRCNEKCIHCYIEQSSEPSLPQAEELSTDEIKRVLEELAELKTLQITFTGGEIFLRRDIKEILQFARALKFNINISTNGILIDEPMADFLKEKVIPWEIGISIYGSRPEIHDAITGIKGSFEKSINAVRLIRQRKMRVKFKTVLMSLNIDDYFNIKKLSDDMDVKMLIDFNITPKLNGDLSPLDLRISDQQIQDFIFDQGIGLDIYKMDLERYNKETELKKNGYLCKGGNNFLNITPFGEITPCVQWYYVLGNIRDNSLHDIWNYSERIKLLREMKIKDIKECRECEYLAYCNRCPGTAQLIDGDCFGISTLSCKYIENIKAVIEKKYKSAFVPT